MKECENEGVIEVQKPDLIERQTSLIKEESSLWS